MVKVGFIGTGNMGGALAGAASFSKKAELFLSNKPIEAAEKLAENISGNCKVIVCRDNLEVIENSEYVFLGVKPQGFKDLAKEIAPSVKSKKNIILVSMMAGTSIEKINSALEGEYPVIRLMPNLPAMVGEGMILYTSNELVKPEKMNEFLEFMGDAGEFTQLPEKLFSAGSGVSGCGPAFAAMFIEALADGGVACGLPRDAAVKLAAQMCKGTAAYILEKGTHPGELKDRVCSPGGTTIQGVRALEANGFRSALSEAVIAAYEKDMSL